MSKSTAVQVDLVGLLTELSRVRAEKDLLSKRESVIRNSVLEATGKVATPIANPETGEILAEVVGSVRRSVSDWDSFESAYPDAYKALVRFTDVLTLTLTK
jgi:hypothetical protein